MGFGGRGEVGGNLHVGKVGVSGLAAGNGRVMAGDVAGVYSMNPLSLVLLNFGVTIRPKIY